MPSEHPPRIRFVSIAELERRRMPLWQRVCDIFWMILLVPFMAAMVILPVLSALGVIG